MALVKYGGGVIQMSGSIAGNTFARNRYGNYVRARTKPVNPNTDRQNAVRSALASLTVRWSTTVTALQRTAWNLYAANVGMLNKLGETIHLSGFNHYIRSNVNQALIGGTPFDAGPGVFELPEHDPLFAIACTEAPQAITITFDDTLAWSTEDGAKLWVYQGVSQNAQRNFFAGPWRRCDHILGIDPGGAASPAAGDVQFPMVEGQHIWAYARIQRADGRISTPFETETFCAA